jgi:hypothetical protein
VEIFENYNQRDLRRRGFERLANFPHHASSRAP